MEQSLLDWWHTTRPFFVEHDASAAAQLDDEAVRLQKLIESDPSFFVCVLGQSAVGKSTLLNAIVSGDQTVLPAGGIGPLTALATEVRYSPEPYLRVTYRDRKQLDGFRLRLENELRVRNRASMQLESTTNGSSEDANEITTAPYEADPILGEDSTGPNAFAEFTKQVTQLVTGSQFKDVDLAILVNAFRAVLGLKTDPTIELSPDDLTRIAAASSAVARGKLENDVLYAKAELGGQFDRILHDHIGGHLAPLVERIEVGYPSPALQNQIVLVDLPGLGVASDRYRHITSEYVRLRAKAVILVVDRAGPTEASVNLIRDSGYWDRLILSSDDPENDPCELVLAVTKIDDVAREQYLQYEHLPKSERPKVADLFAGLRAEVQTAIQSQAESCFSTLSQGPATDSELVDARRNARTTLLNSLKVFPLSATQYRYLLADDEELRPFLRDIESSGIPAFTGHLESLAQAHRVRRDTAKASVEARLARSALGTLGQIESAWSTGSRAAEEAAKLRDELERFLEPKRLELANRTGAFREFLENSGTARIEELVAKAQNAAQIDVNYYLKSLRDVHWSTLRATVMRGGAFISGRGVKVELIAEVAQRFQEPMAGIWGKTLLKDIRARTRQHGNSLERAIADICAWADAHSETVVQRQVLRAQQQLMTDRVQQLGQVGNEAVDDLKDAIKRNLMATIETPIRKKCEAFVEKGDAFGPGVKRRILDLFDQLSNEAVMAAAGPATHLLQSRFIEVRTDIAKALEDWGDPIQQAADAIVEREEQRQMRSDVQRRSRILLALEEVRASFPASATAYHEVTNVA